jgi:hypothetical protein
VVDLSPRIEVQDEAGTVVHVLYFAQAIAFLSTGSRAA